MRRVAFFVIGCLVTAAGVGLRAASHAASQQEKSDALKIRSTEILVDAVVVDRKNRLVTDLTAQDFEVYEGGVLQEVTSFRIVRGPAEKPADTSPAAKSAPAVAAQPPAVDTNPAPAAESLPNVTIVLLDYSTTQ